jgi:hypothetical protein
MSEATKIDADERVVFVVELRSMDINCARLVSEPSECTKMVKMKHRGRAVEVPSMLCHDTLEEAKVALAKWVQSRLESIAELEYDAENFWVV